MIHIKIKCAKALCLEINFHVCTWKRVPQFFLKHETGSYLNVFCGQDRRFKTGDAQYKEILFVFRKNEAMLSRSVRNNLQNNTLK